MTLYAKGVCHLVCHGSKVVFALIRIPAEPAWIDSLVTSHGRGNWK